MTVGDTIYLPKGMDPHVLAHEMVHVWQYQNGGTDYLSEALFAQNMGDGYDWEKGVNDGKSWEQLNPEQQAALIEAMERADYFVKGGPFLFNGKDYTAYAERALAELRRGHGAP